MKALRLGVLAAVGASVLGCLVPTNTEVRPLDGRPVLFIGNSLTYVNDLPLIIRALAEADGQEPFGAASVVAADASLEDHWYAGNALDAIRQGGWEVVVMQQGPSSLPQNQEHLRVWSERFAPEIRAVGARPAMYMVWPDISRQFAFDAVSDSYRLAAEAIDGLLFPVGEAWRAAWRRDANAPLYSGDGFHPSAAGSYLAALVIYQQLYDRSPIGLPSSLTIPGRGEITLDANLALTLQEAAAEANDAFARPRPPALRSHFLRPRR